VGVADARPDLADHRDLRAGRTEVSLVGRLERLPDSHPASPRYSDGRSRVDDRVRPLTDAEHADHVADVRVRLDHARAAGLSTDHRHTIDPGREVWSRARSALHDVILDDLNSAACDVPCGYKAIIAGGLPGSGKTTVLNRHAGIDLSKFLMINPDGIKEAMAARGLIPEVAGLSPMEASDLAHEEASHIAKRLARQAQADGKNVVWDVTMSSPTSAELRVGELRAAGYRSVDGIFIDIPVAASVQRAAARHRVGHDLYRQGFGLGERCIPAETIMEQSDPEWGSRNRRNFEDLKRSFDNWSRFDNSADGRAPVLAESYVRSQDIKEERG
jgi:predicted kinase